MTDVTLRSARRSTLAVAAVLAAIAAWQAIRGRPTVGLTLGITSLVLLAFSAVERTALAFHRRWMAFAMLLGRVNSRVLLTAVYVGVMSPIGLGTRLAGLDPLERRGPRKRSYWIERRNTRQSRSDFERAF